MRLLVFVLAACGSSSSQPKLLSSGHTGPVTPAKLLTADDFERAGYILSKVSETETLVCPKGLDAVPSSCVCLADLGCTGAECLTLTKNLEAFRAALARDHETVLCELADTGRYCDLAFFRFMGDIHRSEVRYFGADGRLVAQTNATDYPEYCEGKAIRQVAGRVPDCTMQTRDVEIICADERYRGQAGELVNPKTLFD